MSIPYISATYKKEETKEEKVFPTVVYQGRKVTTTELDLPFEINPEGEKQLLVGGSFFSRIICGMSLALGENPRSFFDQMPVPIKTLFGRLESLVGSVEMDEETSDALVPQVDTMFHQAITSQRHQLMLAGVSSLAELREKSGIIEGHKALATQAYLSNPDDLARKKAVDDALIQAWNNGIRDEACHAIVDRYWNAIASRKDGYAKMKEIKERSSQLFMDGMFNAVNEMMASGMGGSADLSVELRKGLNLAMERTAKQLQEERSKASTEDRILLDYLILKGQIQMPSMVNILLHQVERQQLTREEELLEKLTPDYFEMFKGFHQRGLESWQRMIKDSEENLQNFERQIAKIQKSTAPEKEKEESIQFYQEMEELEKKHLKVAHEGLEKERLETEEEIRERAISSIKSVFGMSKHKRLMPKLSTFDKQVMRWANINEEGIDRLTRGDISSLEMSPDMRIDLRSSDIQSRLIDNMRKEDERHLALFRKPTSTSSRLI